MSEKVGTHPTAPPPDKKELARQSSRVPRRYRSIVRAVNALEPKLRKLSDEALLGKAKEWRSRHRKCEGIDDLMPEVFAAVRESAWRAIGLRAFDTQLVGGIVLHRGRIAEMQTGEGKTLVATFPAALNAVPGKGVHVVTVNEYLAERDAEWMGDVHRRLGYTVGCILPDQAPEERHAAYASDITYGTNKDFGFDFLRDTVRRRALARQTGNVLQRYDIERGALAKSSGYVQRGHYYAVVDEVDSVLIDEARVPLILSGSAGQPSPYAAAFRWADEVWHHLRPVIDYAITLKEQKVELTQTGRQRVREHVGKCEGPLPPDRPIHLLVEQAIRANKLFQNERQYLIRDGEVVIVDEFTGRVLPDRNWQLGFHQAVLAKEGLAVTDETQTLATVTYQRYFRLYEKLCGMTGTAWDARREFKRVYDLKVTPIPTNRKLRRIEMRDLMFRSQPAKLAGVAERVRDLHRLGRPVLVGTRSVDKSEALSKSLTELGISHSVLNAKRHAEEAEIVANAGQAGQVTICTNMAGRGTDIELGEGVSELGGMHVIGTERHDARRIDRQLGGRAARQGDPGSYQFMLAMDDELLRRRYRKPMAWLRRLTRRRRRRPLRGPWMRWFLAFAQKRIEHEHVDGRVALMDRDKWLDEVQELMGMSPAAKLKDDKD